MNCGLGRRKITPDRPMPLAGFASRDHHFEGVYQDLWLKALAFEEGGLPVVIVTSDLLYYDDSVLSPVEGRLAELHGLPPDRFFFTATHTHCGPSIRIADNVMYGDRDERYIGFLQDSLVEVVGEALADLSPAEIRYHRGTCDININRRLLVDGHIQMSPNPDGVVDRDVDILAIHRADDVRAVLFGYPCHATTMGGYLVGGDYPGFAQEFVEEHFPGAQAMFVQGCTGDMRPNNVDENSRFKSGPLEVVQSLGRRLGDSVVEALGADGTRVSGDVRSFDRIVALPLMDPPSREEVAAKLSDARESRWVHWWAETVLDQMDRGIELMTSAPVHVQALRIGDEFAFVAMAGEVCVEIGLRVKQIIGDGPRFAIGYTNRSMGYIPSKSIHPFGGYEVNGSHYWEGFPAPYADSVEDILAETARDLITR
jgi:neutral ceramidase